MNRFTPSNYFLPHVSFEVYINRDVLLGFNVFPSDVLRTLLLLSLDKELHEITFFFFVWFDRVFICIAALLHKANRWEALKSYVKVC